MRIVVAVKQVPDTSEVRIDEERGTLIREGIPAILNPFDEYALEEAMKWRDELGGTVTVVTMGPPQAEAVLREAISIMMALLVTKSGHNLKMEENNLQWSNLR